jgi:Xaa-Pro aminopeptidase
MVSQSRGQAPARISTGELERRWKAARQAMRERNLDFLLMQGGGSVRWFTDIPGGGGMARTVIFPQNDEMTMISHGPRAPAEPLPAASAVRGVKKRVSLPYNASLAYTNIWDAEVAVAELAKYRNCRIGLVGMAFINAAFYKYLTEHLDTARFEVVTDMIDAIKAIKSDEELGLIKETCIMQDALFDYALTRVQPGRRVYEVQADLIHKWTEMGGEGGNIMVDSAPAGKPATIPASNSRFRMLEKGDQFNLLIETVGPGGFWCEITRTICLGKISRELETQWGLAKEAQKVTLDLLKPGADPVACWNANNEFLKTRGYPEEMRLYAHGQGYDMVERPCLMPGETLKIQARMNMAIHPAVMSPKAYAWVCENYIVNEKGEKELLHSTPKKLFVI